MAPDNEHLQKSQGDPKTSIQLGEIVRGWDGQRASRGKSNQKEAIKRRQRLNAPQLRLNVPKPNQASNARYRTWLDSWYYLAR